MEMTPRIAVAITTYNQAHYVGETIRSVFNQSLAPAEIVVVDDGSTDDTPAALARFQNKVRVIRQENAGVAAARNAAVRACSAEFVALLDGDDLWHPDKLRRSMELLQTFGAPALLAHDVERMSSDGTVLDRGEIEARLADLGQSHAAIADCLALLLQGSFIWTTSQVVVRRSAYMDVGLSDQSFPVASDYDLYLRLAARGHRFLLSDDVLTRWRQHDESASGRGVARQFNWAVDVVRVLKKARAREEMAAHIDAIDRRQAMIVRIVYSSESRGGRLPTARALARIAWVCRNPHAAFAAAAVLLTPQSLRRLAASFTGVSVSTGPER